MSGWKVPLHEPHAIGWIGFMFLVAAIGVGALYFGGGSTAPAPPPVPQQTK